MLDSKMLLSRFQAAFKLIFRKWNGMLVLETNQIFLTHNKKTKMNCSRFRCVCSVFHFYFRYLVCMCSWQIPREAIRHSVSTANIIQFYCKTSYHRIWCLLSFILFYFLQFFATCLRLNVLVILLKINWS